MRRLLAALPLLLLGGCSVLGGGPEVPMVEPELDLERPADRAILEARKRVSDAPDDPQAQLALGNAYLRRGWVRLAREAYGQLTELTPDDARAWNNLGLAELRLKNHGAAAKAFERAIKLDPAFADAHYNRASLYELEADFEPALRHYKLAVIAQPSLADLERNPHAKESQLLLAALVSIYLEEIGSLALEPSGQPENRLALPAASGLDSR